MSDPLLEAAKLFDIRQQRSAPKPGEVAPFPALNYADLKPEEWEWLWTGRFPLGEVSYLEGYAGDGKSSVMADMVAHVSDGVGLAADQDRPPAGVIWFTTEESPTKTIVKRLKLAGARMANVRHIDTVALDKERTNLSGFTFPSGRGRLSSSVSHYAREMGVPVRLVVIDGVLSIFDRGMDMNSAQDVRVMLGALRSVAQEHNLAVICIRHPSKAKGGLAQHRSGGSTAWNDFVRMSWLVGQEPGTEWNEYKRVLVSVKKNAGRAYPGLKFHTEWDEDAKEVRVIWDDICTMTADEVYAAREAGNQQKASDEQINSALDVLRKEPGEVDVRKARSLLRGSGLPGDAAFKALTKLNSEKRRRGYVPRDSEGE